MITSERGRAKQLNAGAAAATGDILIFLHADIWLESGALAAVATAMSAGYVGGGFRQKIDGDSILYRLIEIAGDMRGRYLRVFYGDSGIFLTRTDFEKLGAFQMCRFSRRWNFQGSYGDSAKRRCLRPVSIYLHAVGKQKGLSERR